MVRVDDAPVIEITGMEEQACSRVEDANEHNEGFHWRNAVIEAFCNAGLDSNHFYKCAVPEYPYWSFFHEDEPSTPAPSTRGPLRWR